jgi:hypothetical protein
MCGSTHFTVLSIESSTPSSYQGVQDIDSLWLSFCGPGKMLSLLVTIHVSGCTTVNCYAECHLQICHLICTIVNCGGGGKLEKGVHAEARYFSDSLNRNIVCAVVGGC